MVKFLKYCLSVSFLSCFLFINGCGLDFFGLFDSSDLGERLRERENFTFIDNYSDRTPAVGNSYSFIVLTDVHIDGRNSRGLEKMVSVITDEIKFVVILGDITQRGSRKEVEKFIDFAVLLRSAGVPCYPVIGNHEIYFGNWPVWKELIGSTNYRIDGDVITFFIMDSANAFFGKAQLDWLERELADTKRDVFVFTHHNIFSEYPADTRQQTDIRERARLVNILRNRCDAVFMGHLHKTLVHETGNVKYISIEHFRDRKIYCVVTVTNGVVTYKIKKL